MDIESLSSDKSSLESQLAALRKGLDSEQSQARELEKENARLKGQNDSTLQQMEHKMMAK